MEPEKTIIEIEWLEQLIKLPDKRPLQMCDWKAANQKHDEQYANDPWFRLWRRDGE
jgi:phosphatidylserine/phosphatidylglycerophosphate/cardiolipin synthase-like enzyme